MCVREREGGGGSDNRNTIFALLQMEMKSGLETIRSHRTILLKYVIYPFNNYIQ